MLYKFKLGHNTMEATKKIIVQKIKYSNQMVQ